MFFAPDDLTPKKEAALRTPPIPETGWRPPAELPDLRTADVIAVDTETREMDFDHGPGWARGQGHIVGVSIAALRGRERYCAYFPLRHEVERDWNMDAARVLPWLKATLETPHIPKVGANLLYDVGWLTEENIYVEGELLDVQFAEALLDSSAPTALEMLGRKYVGEGKASNELYDWCAQAYGGKADGKQRANIYRAPPRLVGPYAESDASLPLDVMTAQWPLLAEQGLVDLFRMECASIPMLVRMRRNGVRINIDAAYRLHDELGATIPKLYDELHDITGVRVHSVAAGRQVARAFDAVGLEYPLTENGSPSFRKEWLSAQEHSVAAKVNEIREHEKIRATFVESYLLKSHVRGKLHCQFHPLRGDEGGTVTGRYSCVAAWTPVVTRRGVIVMRNVVVGDMVWTHRNRWRRVLATWLKGKEDMLTITFSSGDVLTCTSAHRLLLSTGEWITAGEAHVRFQKMAQQPSEYRGGCSALPQQGYADESANRQRITNDLLDDCARHSCEHAASGTESTGRASIFRVEASRAEPNVRKKRRGASQLDWLVRRWIWLFNCFGRGRKAAVCASHSDGAIAWVAGASAGNGCASHRWGQKEQRPRQFGPDDARRTQDDTFYAGEGLTGVTIEKIDIGGSHQVYDITVDEDESYFACGVFSHNSSTPNLQNISVRTKLGKKIRKLFIPFDDHVEWASFDYSQIEYRMLAQFAVGPGSDQLRETYQQDPRTDYHNRVFQAFCAQVGLDYATMSKEEKAERRKPIKNINFGLLYGQSQKSLAYKAGMSTQDAEEFFASYHQSAPYVKPTMKSIANEVQSQGYITTILGRRTRFNLWEPREGRSVPLPYRDALVAYGRNIKRAGDYKGTNYKFQGSAADVMKAGMLRAYKDGVFDVIGVPLTQVHDEINFSVIDRSPIQQEAYRHLVHCMEHCVSSLRIPLAVDEERGPNWGSVE